MNNNEKDSKDYPRLLKLLNDVDLIVADSVELDSYVLLTVDKDSRITFSYSSKEAGMLNQAMAIVLDEYQNRLESSKDDSGDDIDPEC